MSRRSLWQGRSTVRTFTAGAGTRFALVNSPRKVQVQDHPQDPEFVLLSVTGICINNLPQPAQENMDRRFGPLGQVLHTCLNGLQEKSPSSADTTSTTSYTLESTPLELLSLDDLFTQAWASGDAMACNVDTSPWRPVLADGTGLYHRPGQPTYRGSICDHGGRRRSRRHSGDFGEPRSAMAATPLCYLCRGSPGTANGGPLEPSAKWK